MLVGGETWRLTRGGLAYESRLEEAGQAWSELIQRFGVQVTNDFARYAGSLAPDPEWGNVVENAIKRAAESAEGAGGPSQE